MTRLTFDHFRRKSRANYLVQSQNHLPPAQRNYNFIEYTRKAYEYETSPYEKEKTLTYLRLQEAVRDYNTGQITEIHNCIQFDQRPSDLRESRWDIYKISLSFDYQTDYYHAVGMKGTDHRVLFQSADGSINMGVCFNDPGVDIYDIFWFNEVAKDMALSLIDNEGLISIDEELQTRSCYAELHRNGDLFLYKVIWMELIIQNS